MEFSGSLCRALLNVRDKGQDDTDSEPGLADFMPRPDAAMHEGTTR